MHCYYGDVHTLLHKALRGAHAQLNRGLDRKLSTTTSSRPTRLVLLLGEHLLLLALDLQGWAKAGTGSAR